MDNNNDKREEREDNTSILHIIESLEDLRLNPINMNELGEGTSSGRTRSGANPSVAVYSNDSIDRFGDDLVELILSYLPFSSKVSLESVCKQWRRVVYNKQRELHLSRSDTEEHNTLNKLLKDIEVIDYATGFAHYSGFKAIDKPSLELMLKKCPLISKIHFQCYTDGEDLELIGKYCHYLKSLECNAIGLKEQTLNEFGRQYGHKLELMRFDASQYCSVFIKKFLNFCPNLTEVYTEENSAFISEDPLFLPKLAVIKSIDIRTEQLMQLKILADKYAKTMKSIKVYTYHMIGHQLKNAITHISQFENLQSLALCISIFDEDMQAIDENIAEIAKSCTKLKKFNFTINNESVITNRLFYCFSKLHSIEKLNLEFYEISKKLDGTVECFKQCSNLKHLVISYKELSEEFFLNIDLFLPKLQILDIECDKQMTDTFMNSLSKLENLKKVVLRHGANAHKDMTDAGVCELLTSCGRIETITFNARPNISLKTVDTLIGIALKRPKTNINFSCGFSAAGDEAQFTQIDVNSYAERIPENLKISIDLGQVVEQNE